MYRDCRSAVVVLLFAIACKCQCPDKNGKYPVPGQCDAYVECLDGEPFQRTCPDGLLFKDNYRSGYPCGYPQEVNCDGRPGTQSPQPNADCPRKFGFFAIGGPNDCGTFMNCAYGRAYIQICPEGLAFNQDTLECDWPDLVPTCNEEAFLGFRCPDNLPESRHASGQCDKYFICLNGRPRLLRCPEKTAFDPQTGTCEDAKNVRNCVSTSERTTTFSTDSAEMYPQSQYYGTDGDVKIDEICRLCRTSKGVMSYIFSSVGVDTTMPISARICSMVNIRMHEGDGLPSLICHRCLFHVEQMNEFKMLCEQSDVLLRQYISYQMEDEEIRRNTNNTSKTSSGVQCGEMENTNGSLSEDERTIKLEGANGESGSENALELYQAMDQSDDQMSDDDDSDENYLNCATCNKRFTLQEALDRHILIHTQDGPFPCDYCAAQMPDKALLRVHWRQVHAGNKSHMCQTCGEAFYLKENLSKHTIRHDKLKPFRCCEPDCNKAFAYRSDLRKHSVIHTGIRPYVCPICFKAFTRSTNLNKHARVHNGSKPFPCGECDKMFATRGDLMRHSLIHTGEKPYSCTICFLSFNRKDKLTRHEKLHTEPQRAHVCTECPTSFNRKEDLTKHVQFHHYSTICGEDGIGIKEEKDDESIYENNDTNGGDGEEMATDLRTNQKKDQDDSRSDDDSNRAVLRDGQKKNGNESTAARNNRMDVGADSDGEDVIISVDPSNWEEPDTVRSVQCDVCCKSFKDPDEYKKHRPTHDKTRDFICEVCFKGFHQRRELVRHSLTHTGYKPYSCETCGKAFSRRDKLTRHMRTHGLTRPGKNPSTCGVCLKSYSSRHNLSRHLLTHTNYKPYQCSICTASYSRKDKLVKHIKSIHSV